MQELGVITLLKEMVKEPSLVSGGRREVLTLAIETLQIQHQQIQSQKEVIEQLRKQLTHLREHMDRWHTVADERTAEIIRLLGELEAMRKDH